MAGEEGDRWIHGKHKQQRAVRDDRWTQRALLMRLLLSFLPVGLVPEKLAASYLKASSN